MRIVGVDLSARPENTAACVLEAEGGQLRATLYERCDDDALLRLFRNAKKIAIDAPFGWPDAFVEALEAHRSGSGWPGADADPDAYRASLALRATDRLVAHTRHPLSVSTDKLGVTAMRCAYLLGRAGKGARDRTGAGRFVEVYPAGALARWSLAASGYKGKGRDGLAAVAKELRARLPITLEGGAEECLRVSHDAFDALIAALVGRAAALGLTDGPPRTLLPQARTEGWIHLPRRGTLELLHHDRPQLHEGTHRENAQAALGKAAGAPLSKQGRVKRVEDVFVSTVPAEAREAVLTALKKAAGSEARARRSSLPKLHSAWSSAALAANTFAPWLLMSEPLPLPMGDAAGEVQLEVACPTGLGGTPPTLDALVEMPKLAIGIESKCTETLSPHVAGFAAVYGEAMSKVHASWREEFRRLKEDPTRYRFLDAAQLVKHYLGLRHRAPRRPTLLLYLYWEPRNAESVPTCSIHRAELAEFAKRVGDPKLRFQAASYDELWKLWETASRPKWLRDHVAALRERYDVPLV